MFAGVLTEEAAANVSSGRQSVIPLILDVTRPDSISRSVQARQLSTDLLMNAALAACRGLLLAAQHAAPTLQQSTWNSVGCTSGTIGVLQCSNTHCTCFELLLQARPAPLCPAHKPQRDRLQPAQDALHRCQQQHAQAQRTCARFSDISRGASSCSHVYGPCRK